MQAGFFDVNYTEGLKVGYKWFDAEHKEPLFPFGFGLSYTTFSYSKIAATPENGLHVSFDIKNTGSRAGAEIAQVYLGLPKSTGEPPKRLVAWDRIELRPGETRRVNLLTDRQMMSIFNSDRNDWELVPGEYRLYVGASSRDVRLTKTFQISGKP
jgi:beta-glucosidase